MQSNSFVSIVVGILLIATTIGIQFDFSRVVGNHNAILQDTQPPEITVEPEDLIYEEGTTGHNLYWEYFDEDLASVNLYLDGALIFTDAVIDNPTSLTWNVDGLSVGAYNYTLYIDDVFSQSAVSEVVVIVYPTDQIPVVSTPSDLFLFAGDPTNSISWVGIDSDPNTYSVYLNGTVFDSGTWTAGTPIFVSLSFLGYGFYNLTIVLADDLGNSVSDTVFVYVFPSTMLMITLPPLFDVVVIICIGIELGGVVLVAILAKTKYKSPS